MIYYKIN